MVAPQRRPLDILTLRDGEVHLWAARISAAQDELSTLAALLSSVESRRALRYRFANARQRFIVGRGLLRRILGQYLRASPEELQLQQEPSGKPYLSGRGQTWLCFNVAHSNDLLLVAVTRGRRIGVDVEHVEGFDPTSFLLKRFFSAGERRALEACTSTAKHRLLLSLWTCKEACGKAAGVGLASPLPSFESSLRRRSDWLGDVKAVQWSASGNGCLPIADASGCTVISWDTPGGSGLWVLQPFEPAPEYVAAVALEVSPALSSALPVVPTALSLCFFAAPC